MLLLLLLLLCEQQRVSEALLSPLLGQHRDTIAHVVPLTRESTRTRNLPATCRSTSALLLSIENGSSIAATTEDVVDEWKKALGPTGRRQKRRQKHKNKSATKVPLQGNLARITAISATKDDISRSTKEDRRKADDDSQGIRLDDIASVRLVPANGDDSNRSISSFHAEVLLQNGTEFTVNPQSLHQRTDQAVWLAVRKTVNVTASEFSAVLNSSFFTTREKLLDTKRQKSSVSPAPSNAKACEWGLRMEPKALAAYCQATGNTVQETGLHILRQEVAHANSCTSTIYLGASPDGLVTDNNAASSSQGLLEIKSLWGRRNQKELPFLRIARIVSMRKSKDN